jgi:hypothetical protein
MPALAEDLAQLLCHEGTGQPVVSRTYLEAALAGAVLLELLQAGRVGLSGDGDPGRRTTVVRDASPTGDPVLDDALRRLTARPLTLRKAIEALTKDTRRAVFDRASARGLLRKESSRVLGLIPVTKWLPDPTSATAKRAGLEAALRDGATSDERTASLITMLHAVKALPKIVGGDKSRLRSRAEEIIEGRWPDGDVRVAVKQVYAAVEANAAAAAAAAAG